VFSRRDAPEVCINFTLLQNGGRRESRVPTAPAVVRTKSARVDHRFNRIIPAFPARWVTAYFVLSPVTGLFATVAFRIDDTSQTRLGRMHLRKTLTPASGRQDHTTSPSATVHAKDLAAPRAARRVLAKTVGSVVRPRAADRSRQHPPRDPIARPTLSRPSHPTARS
jgi:hypothetical protein